ncbi:helix-turn-helix transcriptional regulator [Novosphingobium aquimarinum]|uniref:helix-turn-helix transcriptional regulator n=1 Tax=Novosphingobium aquimarinum TaxID=2682494 RepID=UPI0018DC84DD|nr:AraC family transcriptional regulator [Novosphingobium aquimarinum]
MTLTQWRVLGEKEVGGVWAAVAEHPPAETIERTHIDSNTTLGLWLSSQPNGSQGRFLSAQWSGGHARMGRIVVVPGNVPLHVKASATPARRMLHCRLPAHVSLPRPHEAGVFEQCLNWSSPVIARSLSRLAREVMAPGFADVAMIEGLGLQIAAELAKGFAKPGSGHKGGLAPWQLRRIDDYILSGHWDCSVSELAALCGISAGHVMRAFRQSSALSLATHIAVLRMERARELLEDESHAVAEVAAHLRFATPSSFCAAFRRATGETPRAYRHRIRRNASQHGE